MIRNSYEFIGVKTHYYDFIKIVLGSRIEILVSYNSNYECNRP